jgi:hypothetical protein
MNKSRRIVAGVEALLLAPAAVFMTALLVRELEPPAQQAALYARSIVAWYAGRQWTLWVLLVALPVASLAAGCATLFAYSRERRGSQRAEAKGAGASAGRRGIWLVAAMTLVAALVLVVVGVHVLAN